MSYAYTYTVRSNRPLSLSGEGDDRHSPVIGPFPDGIRRLGATEVMAAPDGLRLELVLTDREIR